MIKKDVLKQISKLTASIIIKSAWKFLKSENHR